MPDKEGEEDFKQMPAGAKTPLVALKTEAVIRLSMCGVGFGGGPGFEVGLAGLSLQSFQKASPATASAAFCGVHIAWTCYLSHYSLQSHPGIPEVLRSLITLWIGYVSPKQDVNFPMLGGLGVLSLRSAAGVSTCPLYDP